MKSRGDSRRGELYKSVNRGLRVSRVLGTLPMKGDMELSKRGTTYTAIVSLVSLLGPFFIMGGLLPSPSQIFRLGLLFVFSLLLTPILLTAPFKVGKLRGICEELIDLEGRVGEGEGVPFSKTIITLLFIKSALMMGVGYRDGDLLTALMMLLTLYYTLLSFGLTLPFTFFLGLIHHRIRSISVLVSEKGQLVPVLLVEYHRLCSLCSRLGKVFGFGNLLMIGSIFLGFTAQLYTLAVGVIETVSPEPLSYLASLGLESLSLLILTLHLFQIVSASTRVTSQAKEFNKALFKIIMNDTTSKLARNNRLMLHVIMKRKVRFTAMGFFPLDFTLIHSMVAAATTYFIILIQFSPVPK